jgi:cytochrome P450
MATLPPGPTSPRVVQLLRYTLRPLSYLEECARVYGDCFTLEFPRIPGTTQRVPRMTFVLFSDPEAIREIFTGDGERLRAGDANSVVEHLVGRHSLLFMDGERHLRERRMRQPPFHGERMQAYGEVMRDITDAVIDGWPLGRPFPIHAEMQPITLEVILRPVFGVDQGPRLTRLRDLLTTAVGAARGGPAGSRYGAERRQRSCVAVNPMTPNPLHGATNDETGRPGCQRSPTSLARRILVAVFTSRRPLGHGSAHGLAAGASHAACSYESGMTEHQR